MTRLLAAMVLGAACSLAHAAESATTPARRLLAVDDIYTLHDLSDPQLSPDAKWLAYTETRLDAQADESRSQVWMVPTAGGDPVPMTSPERSASNPRWSPDGRYLAFLAAPDEDQKSQVWTLFLEGGEAVKRTAVTQGVSGFEWAPDSRRFVLVIEDPTAEEAKRAAEGKEAAKDEDEEKAAPPWVITRRQFKRDYVGYLDNRRTHLYVSELATQALTQITRGDYDDSEPAWSPDGHYLAFTSNRTEDPDSNEDTDIWRASVDAPNEPPVRVGSSKGADSDPAWSPDGRWIAYASAADTAALVYATPLLAIAPAAGGDARLLTQALDRPVSAPHFANDGRSIYCLVEDEREHYLARVDARDGRLERVIHGARVATAYDLGRDGTIAALLSDPVLYGELFTLKGSQLTQRTHVNMAVLNALTLGAETPIDYPSADGTRVQGFLLTPPGYVSGQRYPTILSIHGGPVSQYDYGFQFDAQLLATAGYVVLLPNPRGSSGRGTDFAHAIWQSWGQKDYEDVIAAVDYAIAAGYTDPDRLGVEGWSYGGMLTDHVITRTDRFKAAISGAGESLYIANYGHDEYQYWWENELGLPWKNRKLWEDLSPFNRVEHVVTPTLLMGGDQDWNVPIINSEQLYLALKRLGVPTELVVYPGQYHLIERPSYLKDLYGRYLDWFARYLGTTPAAH